MKIDYNQDYTTFNTSLFTLYKKTKEFNNEILVKQTKALGI